MIARLLTASLLFTATLAVAQTPAPLPDAPSATAPQTPAAPTPTGPTAVIDTTMGRLTCKLFSAQSPLATANFIGLAEGTKTWTDPTTHKKMHNKPLFDNTQFHRDLDRMMAQLTDAVRSFKALADLLNQHPEALVRGRGNAP